LGEDTPPPVPPEPKKSTAGRLKDYVISAATSPEILLRDHLEAPVARYIAGIVTNEENFKPDDDDKDRANPLDAYMLSSLLSSEDQQLRTKVQALIAEEIQRLDILESEYGRADGIFRNQVRFSSADREGLEIVKDGAYTLPAIKFTDQKTGEEKEAPARAVCFTAIRVNKAKHKIDLIDVRDTIESAPASKGGVSRSVSSSGKSAGAAFRYSMGTLTDVLGPEVKAIANAGWSRGAGRPNPVGAAFINGKVVALDPYPSLSTFLCLDDKVRWAKEKVQVPAAFGFTQSGKFSIQEWSTKKRERVQACDDLVQVGPRIIEIEDQDYKDMWAKGGDLACLADEPPKSGVCRRSLARRATFRTIFATDAPDIAPDAANAEADGPERRLYIVATSNKVSLYNAQMMLLDPAFYGDAKAHWAVNMAGHTQLGMVARGLPDGRVEIGNLDANIATALIITPHTITD